MTCEFTAEEIETTTRTLGLRTLNKVELRKKLRDHKPASHLKASRCIVAACEKLLNA